MPSVRSRLAVSEEAAEAVREALWHRTGNIWSYAFDNMSMNDGAHIIEKKTGRGFLLTCTPSKGALDEPDRYQLEGRYVEPASQKYNLWQLMPMAWKHSVATCRIGDGVDGIVRSYFRMCKQSYDKSFAEAQAAVADIDGATAQRNDMYGTIIRIFGEEYAQTFSGFAKEASCVDIPHGNVEYSSKYGGTVKLRFTENQDELMLKVLRAVRDVIKDAEDLKDD